MSPARGKGFHLSGRKRSLPQCRENLSFSVNSRIFLYLFSVKHVSPIVQTAGYMLLLVTMQSGKGNGSSVALRLIVPRHPGSGASRYVLNFSIFRVVRALDLSLSKHGSRWRGAEAKFVSGDLSRG